MDRNGYQARYLEYQADKKDILEKEERKEIYKAPTDSFETIVKNRRSIRLFTDTNIDAVRMNVILDNVLTAPSSCNRQGIVLKILDMPFDIEAIDLVGGGNWIKKANKVLLLFADMNAYKSPNEVSYMPYLDAGVIAMTIAFTAESLGIGSCIVNPNIRQENISKFYQKFNPEGFRFCCAVALGYSAIEAKKPTKKSLKDLLV
jgi:nitroreductase